MNNFNKICSVTRPLTAETDWMSLAGEYPYLLLVATDGVRFLRGGEEFSAERLIELRAFSAESELHVCRNGDRFVGRIRTDGDPTGEETEYLEQAQVLWGKVKKNENGNVRLEDDRGIVLFVPADIEVRENERVLLVVRSYLAKDRFTFTDYRICGFAGGEEEMKDE